jgi:hypothetical protein
MTAINLQNSFTIFFYVPIHYYEKVQAALRRLDIIEDKLQDAETKNTVIFYITVADVQDAALIDTIVKRIVKP